MAHSGDQTEPASCAAAAAGNDIRPMNEMHIFFCYAVVLCECVSDQRCCRCTYYRIINASIQCLGTEHKMVMNELACRNAQSVREACTVCSTGTLSLQAYDKCT